MPARGVDIPQHEVSIVVAGHEIRDWISYEHSGSMLEPAAQFSFRMPFVRSAWDLVKPDRPVKFFVDGVLRLVGFIDDREVPEEGDEILVTGRDLVGRLVDESVPTLDFRGLKHLDLITKVSAPWFTKVTGSNERNRNVVRGRGRKARATDKPLTLRAKAGTRIEPGMSRQAVIDQLCDQSGALWWSAGDGRELVVGQPNYEQEVQFRFFMPAADSARTHEATVLAMGIKDSVESMYSRIICVGSGQGTDANYGAAVASRYGEARDNFAHAEGIGDLFSAPKRLIIQRSAASVAEANELALRELYKRYASTEAVTVRAPGLGQLIAGAYTTLFGYDLLASVEDERTGRAGVYLITGYAMRGNREGADETSMQLVPKGTELAP